MTTLARTLGPYRIERLLGTGSSAAVYLAKDRRNGQMVALKVFAPGGSPAANEPSEMQRRFLQESEAVKRLHHPDIVRVHEVGQSEDQAWIAMELAIGCPLDHYTHPQRLLPPAQVLAWGVRLALALAHAHAQGVAHRDLKPSNVLVDLGRQDIKLADFGIARLLDTCRTRTEVMLGSPAYMAPELLAGAQADTASDLYSLGVMLFELLSGQRPHDSASMGELLRQVSNDPAPDLRQLCPGLPAEVAAAVAHLLAKQPSQRPANAAAAAAELAALLPRQPGGAAAPAAAATPSA